MDGLDIRTTPFSYYKDSTFFIGNKGRTAINPNIFYLCLRWPYRDVYGVAECVRPAENLQKVAISGNSHASLF